MKEETLNAELAPTGGEKCPSTEEQSAHLAFRQIVVHEFSGETELHPLRLHFHYREHSKHIRRAA